MKAELLDWMGSDVTIVNAARVSFDKKADVIEDKDVKLINYLAKHNHFTPFTHATISMRETVPFFVARQRMKHVVGFTYNEVSRRYVDSRPSIYTPPSLRSRPEGSIKQGSGAVLEDSDNLLKDVSNFNEDALATYDWLLDQGVAPEQARIVLPMSTYTSYWVTGSLMAWARAYKLRHEESAQLEIQELAEQWDRLIRPLFPISWKALVGEK